MTRTIWLASYPKSGNTWFRMLLANLGREVPVDINDLSGRGGIASARRWFDDAMLFPSGLLTHDECDRMRPRVHEVRRGPEADDRDAPDDRDDTDAAADNCGDVRFVKTHDAWTITAGGEPLLGGSAAADAAILIVRDPRDVASSLAGHNGQSVDDAIGFMMRAESAFCGRDDRQPNQMRQQLRGWSGYHRSWIEQTVLPVHRVRYEDLQADVVGTFARALGFAGSAVPVAHVERAARFADFAKLQAQERRHGFREAPRRRPGAPAHAFFRNGKAGGWRSELTADQCATIETAHSAVMTELGYAPAGTP